MQLFAFFSIFNEVANITQMKYVNFLGPFTVFLIGYIATYFFPLPKFSLNINDTGAYYWERAEAWLMGEALQFY